LAGVGARAGAAADRAYNPPSFRNVHADAADATRAFLDLNARWMVPMQKGVTRFF